MNYSCESFLDYSYEGEEALEGIFSNLFKKKESSDIKFEEIEEIHPIDPIYNQFVTVAINYDPRNIFKTNKKIPSEIPNKLQSFYKQSEPYDVSVELDGNNLRFYAINELNRLNKEYPYVSKGGRFIFATINSDPIYLYNGKIYTTYHSNDKPRDELICSSFKDFLKRLIYENGSKNNERS